MWSLAANTLERMVIASQEGVTEQVWERVCKHLAAERR